jgi:hypothetical protein
MEPRDREQLSQAQQDERAEHLADQLSEQGHRAVEGASPTLSAGDDATIARALALLEARIAELEGLVRDLYRLITIPAPGDPEYKKALAKVLPYWEKLDAEERAAGHPPTWPPLRRAAASLRELRRFKDPAERQKISDGLRRYYARKDEASRSEQDTGEINPS